MLLHSILHKKNYFMKISQLFQGKSYHLNQGEGLPLVELTAFHNTVLVDLRFRESVLVSLRVRPVLRRGFRVDISRTCQSRPVSSRGFFDSLLK